MKTLQSNFTTPEQSKRLLKLGVPAKTADCVLENLDTAENGFVNEEYTRWIIEERHMKSDIFTESNIGIFLPCWSTGRLIEIFRICGDIECLTWLNARYSRWDIEDLVQSFELYAQEDDILPETVLNFSKLGK